MLRPFVLLTAMLVLTCSIVSAQTIQFKKYRNTLHQFAFDIPVYWTIKYSKEQEGIICVPVTKEQKEMFKDCYEGIVFRVEVLNYGLDSLLREQYHKDGDNYTTTDRVNDKVPVDVIRGKGWTGIYHNNTCGITCAETGFHAAAGECMFIYFSNGKKTIEITTNGRAFDKEILDRIISGFRFTL